METFNLVRRAAAATGSVLNVLLFGARDDSDGMGGGTDAAPAINGAILALDPLRGGIIEIPYGKYRIATPIHVQRGVTLRGAGGGQYVEPPTQLVADAGVTAIMVWGERAPGPDSEVGGYGAVIERLVITAAGKNTTMVTGSYTPTSLVPNHVTLSSPGDFQNNQMVRVGGVGQASRLQRTTASTVVGSPIVTFNSPVYEGTSAGVRVEMWLIIGTAYPTPSKVVAVNGNQVTMRDQAVTTLTDSPVDYVDDLYARVIKGGGTTELILDNLSVGLNPQSNANTEISHGDCGIYARTRCTIRDVSVGQSFDDPITGFKGTDFVGCGVHFFGQAFGKADPRLEWPHLPVDELPVNSEASGWRVENLFVAGCRHGLKIHGKDCQVGKCEQIRVHGSLSWAVLDMSFLGNEYSSLLLAGGSGILTLDNPGCRCTIIGAYNELGTASHFGTGTHAVGGTIGSDLGGYSWVGGLFNRLQIGSAEGDGSIFSHQVRAYPTGNFFNFSTQKAPDELTATGLTFRMSNTAAEGITGYFEWVHDRGIRKIVSMVSDKDTGLSGNPGDLWFPRGFWIGWNGLTPLPDPARARLYTLDVLDPVTFNLVNRVGNVQFYGDSVPGGYIGWACTAAGTPGTHTTFGEIVSQDLLAKSVSSGTVTLDENECAHRRIRFIGTLTGDVVAIVQTPAAIFPGANSPAPNSFDKIFQNQTTGAFTLTLKTIAADPGIALAQGKTQHMWSDGMNLFAVAGPA